ncbi:MAG: LysR family transcriptional regulator [Pseudomonadota bacterium]
MAKPLVWDDLRAFLAVARAGSLSGAVAQLSIGIATVSRRIERLESALGQPVFTRHQSGYRLTDEGAALVERAEEMEAAAQAITSGFRQDAPVSGVVRLATAENLANALIVPALGRLRETYPNLSLEILTDVTTVNLHRRDADIALRMVKPDRGNVTLQRLGPLGFGLYGSTGYLSRRVAASDASSYETDAFIGWTEAYTALPAAQWIERVLQGRPAALTTTSLASQMVACAHGLGLAVLPHFLARPQGLVCLDGDLGVDQTIWLVTHSDLAQSRRVGVVADFLRDLVKRQRAALAG